MIDTTTVAREHPMKMRTMIIICLLLPLIAFAQDEPGPCAAGEHRQFDFWLGRWTAYSKDGRKQGTNHLHKIMDGCGMQENWVGASGDFEGTSYNFYMPEKGKWHQTWVDNSGGRLLLEGGFNDGRMRLRGSRPGKDGTRVIDRITWTPLPDGRVRQHWQASGDGGKTWSEVFDGYYQRDPE